MSQVAQRWETNFATSRDLVGRLPTPGGSTPADRSRTLYQLGASLYVESARAVPTLVAAADPVARAEALKRVNRLTSLGDHLFDAGTRVLGPGSDGAGPVAVTRIPTPEVPDFAAAGLDPGPSGSPSPPSAPYGDRTPQVTPSQWISRHGGEIAEAVAIFDRSVAWVTAPEPAPATNRGPVADALERLAARLGADVPAVREGREGVQILRLALLVQAEALRSPGSGPTGEAVAPARRLRLMAEQLWAVARDLLVTGNVGRPGRYGLVASGLDPGLLRSGGVFDGRPPQLRPGEDPGTGVPGGLPDISQIAS